MKHRREIDGLRAVAVLPVILFHAGFSWFRGGFLGVDIFFVISGYLITGIILQDLAVGKFSIRTFYIRRARRILPALFAVTLLCIPVAFAWMLPSQYEDFSRSIFAVVLFVSNIFFWRESGYFAAAASEKPLLHTWSLGVEEQYYLFFPLALILLWRLGRQRAFYGIALAAVASLLLCEYSSRHYINVNFFLIPSRAWELLAGSLCAFLPRIEKHHHGLAALGLGLVLFALFAYDGDMRLPSAYSLAPVLGTALILRYGTQGSGVGRMLSWRGPVGIGRISYSAYLWHYPIFAFAHIRLLSDFDSGTKLALVASALLGGAMSWRFIEQPFRDQKHRHYMANRPACILACGMAMLLLAAGLYGYLTHGRLAYWTQHTAADRVRAFQLVEAAQGEAAYDNGDCVFHSNLLTDAVETRLIACQEKYGPGIALIGDSHGENLFFVAKAKAVNQRFMVGISQPSCRLHSPRAECYYGRFMALLEQHPALFHDVVYEEAGWHLLDYHRPGDSEKDVMYGLPLDVPVPDFAPDMAAVDKVVAYLTRLAHFTRVTWLGPRMEPKINPSVLIQKGCDSPFRLRPNQAHVFQQLDHAIAARLAGTPIRYRSQMAMMHLDMAHDFMTCDTLYWQDGNHYSPAGTDYFGQRITLQKILGP